MKVELASGRVLFMNGTKVAGECVLDDPFKPYLHPLRTPGGHLVTNAMPVDHRHHKGLMFALRCEDLNFWEEKPGTPQCGLQRIVEVKTKGNTLELNLLWHQEGGGMETYRERRRISCTPGPQGGFHWTWRSRREALRDHRLIQSEWSQVLPDGRKVNYHGLGIRLPWSWAWPGPEMSGVRINGQTVTAGEACGTRGPEVTLWGKIDGHWHPPLASVTMRQDHGFDWFVLSQPFPYLSAGPTNRVGLDVIRGEIFEETYQVHIQDLT